MRNKEPNSNTLFLYLHCRNENHNVTKRMKIKEENGDSQSTCSSHCDHGHDLPNAKRKKSNDRRQLVLKVNWFAKAALQSQKDVELDPAMLMNNLNAKVVKTIMG